MANLAFPIYSNMVSVKDFGAVCDGSTDDTTAFEATIAYANSQTPRMTVLVVGNMKFTPSLEQIPNSTTIYVNGTLKPTGGTETIYLGTACKLIGLGGAVGISSGVQFTSGAPTARILPTGTGPVISNRESSSEGITIANFTIYDCASGIYLQALDTVSALAVIENVNIRQTGTGGYCMKFDMFFWLWVKDCSLISAGTNGHGWYITNSDFDPFEGAAGLYYFTDNKSVGNGHYINGVSSSPTCSNIYIKNHHHESLPAGGTYWYLRYVNRITFDQVGQSDPLMGDATVFDCDSTVTGLRILNSDRYMEEASGVGGLFNNSQFPGNFMVELTNNASAGTVAYDPGHRLLSRSIRVINSGEVDDRQVWRAPGAPVLNMGNAVAITPTTNAGFGSTVTTGQLAPDGSSTASLYTSTGNGGNWINANFDVDGGDHIIIFGWVKSNITYGEGTTKVIPSTVLICAGLTLTGTLAMTYASGSPAQFGVGGMARQWLNAGWYPIYGLTPITGSKSGNSNLAFGTQVTSGVNFYFWKWGYSIVKAAQGYDTATLVHHMNSIGAMVPGGKNGVIGLQTGQPFAFGQSTTSALPAASSVTAGTTMYDTDRATLVVSTGSAWKVVSAT